ncbi:molybdenum cofactor guanylyltransferase [Rhodospirillum rubrum]|uniref:molybdenum cofactor guanylyltransferase n=1 Tax=Rhodospirillum rubrum TaxID=1085 RepID=UPI001F5C05A0|nr:NTP transferase domain-containing protein [Rhodospirillum rubrum]
MNTTCGAPLPARTDIACGLLAGGEGKRLGGVSKALVPIAGQPMAAWALDSVRRSVGAVALSVHAPDPALAVLGLPQVSDGSGPRLGPLAAVAALLDWAEARGAKRLLTLPVDTPFPPADLAERLTQALDHAAAADPGDPPVAVASFAGRRHNAVALWPVGGQVAAIAHRLCRDGGGALRALLEEAGSIAVAFDDLGPEDPFLNVNTPEDLAQIRGLATTRLARRMARTHP